jgi:hypothetical protein
LIALINLFCELNKHLNCNWEFIQEIFLFFLFAQIKAGGNKSWSVVSDVKKWVRKKSRQTKRKTQNQIQIYFVNNCRALKHASKKYCSKKGELEQNSAKMNAVEVRGGFKFYGKEKDPKIVLNRLNMTVTHGSMWVLII